MQQSRAKRRTVEESAFELLRRLELATIFAGPGSSGQSWHPAVPEGFRIVAHDQCSAAVTTASAYARITGATALVAIASEMDVVGTAAPLLAATQGGDPLVVVVFTRPGWRDSAVGLMLPGPWAKQTLVAEQRRYAPSVLAAAFELSMQTPRGPVVVMVPARPAPAGASPGSGTRRDGAVLPHAEHATARVPASTAPREAGHRALGPVDIVRALRAAAPEDTVLVDDGRARKGPMAAAWSPPQPEMRHWNLHGISGWELPFAVGVALAERDLGRMRPVLAVTTAASVLATISALTTAVQLRLPLVTVALNEHGQRLHALAAAYDARTTSIRGIDALAEATAAAWSHDGPTVVNVLPQ
ncbi:MAG: hypothetical protein KDB08_03785 [Microthrixaceae bacterium]|nr:hypothetical protein [Microthrixaceae bacterium]